MKNPPSSDEAFQLLVTELKSIGASSFFLCHRRSEIYLVLELLLSFFEPREVERRGEIKRRIEIGFAVCQYIVLRLILVDLENS